MGLEDIDSFTRAAIVVACSTTVDDAVYSPCHVSVLPQELLHANFWTDIKKDCASFQRENAGDIGDALAQAGENFWKVRNGADAWEGEWSQEAADRLKDAARKYRRFILIKYKNGQIKRDTTWDGLEEIIGWP